MKVISESRQPSTTLYRSYKPAPSEEPHAAGSYQSAFPDENNLPMQSAVSEKRSPSVSNWSAVPDEDYLSVSARPALPEEEKLRADQNNQSLLEPSSKNSGSDFKMKASTPDDSVGQLASMLARAETKMDVQQVNSKAMRALANLKMAALAGESEDAKKIAQMIKRMEKLLKRIQKKLKHLSKEEQMKNQRKRAQEAMEEQKEKQIREELRTRRNKRRRDERNYALKEISEDNKNSANEMVSSMKNAFSDSSSADISGLTGTGSYSSDSSFADISSMEGISVDVTV